MKKVAILILCMIMTIALVGCGHEHTWQEATCISPKTCSECGETEGGALGHSSAVPPKGRQMDIYGKEPTVSILSSAPFAAQQKIPSLENMNASHGLKLLIPLVAKPDIRRELASIVARNLL